MGGEFLRAEGNHGQFLVAVACSRPMSGNVFDDGGDSCSMQALNNPLAQRPYFLRVSPKGPVADNAMGAWDIQV